MFENLTIDDAAGLLARRKVASQLVGGLVKQAEMPAWLTTLVGNDALTGTLRNTAIGAAAGAGVGGLSRAFSGDEDADIGGGALRGALTGGALGGGLTAATHAGRYYLNNEHVMGEQAGQQRQPSPAEAAEQVQGQRRGPELTAKDRLMNAALYGGITGGITELGVRGVQAGRTAGQALGRNAAIRNMNDLPERLKAHGITSGTASSIRNEGLGARTRNFFTRNGPGGLSSAEANTLVPRTAVGRGKYLGKLPGILGLAAAIVGGVNDPNAANPWIDWKGSPTEAPATAWK